MKPIIQNVKTAWKNFLTGGVRKNSSSFLLRKIVFTNSFLLVSIFSLAFFGVLHVSLGSDAIGLFESVCSLIALGNIGNGENPLI